MKELQAKSIHIFAWPFLINDDNGQKEFKEKINEAGWVEKELDYHKHIDIKNKLMEQFMIKQYFSHSAKNIYMNKSTKACSVYTYPMKEADNYSYEIKVGKEKTYILDVYEIELHVYDYGAGILFYKLLNMDNTTDLADIKKINDYGRRVSIPFLPAEKEDYILCADSIGIKSEQCEIVMDYRGLIEKLYSGENSELAESTLSQQIVEELLCPANFIEYTLNANLNKKRKNVIKVTTETEKCIKKMLTVTALADDRMFVMSMIRDNALSLEIRNKELRENDSFLEKLYSIIFIDSSDASCQHKQMRKELLDKASYVRWTDWGTLFAATGYSFVCMTTESSVVDYSVVRPFYLEYIYIISLVLAQRTSIIKFSANAEVLAKKMLKKIGFMQFISKSASVELVDLQEKYISFINRMLILEVSCQEQGVELYRLLKKQLLIEDEKEILDEQMHAMYEAVNTSNGSRVGLWGLIWAVIAIIVSMNLPAVLEVIINAIKSIAFT